MILQVYLNIYIIDSKYCNSNNGILRHQISQKKKSFYGRIQNHHQRTSRVSHHTDRAKRGSPNNSQRTQRSTQRQRLRNIKTNTNYNKTFKWVELVKSSRIGEQTQKIRRSLDDEYWTQKSERADVKDRKQKPLDIDKEQTTRIKMPRNILRKLINRNQKQTVVIETGSKITENLVTLEITSSFKGLSCCNAKPYQLFETVSRNA